MATIKEKPDTVVADNGSMSEADKAKLPPNVVKRLLAVQSEVIGPRGQRGKFGASRSAESILAEVKPIAVRHGLLITSTDRTEVVEERRYLVAQVTAVNVDDPADYWQVEGRAWEGEPELTRDGRPINDTPQVTGKASSYATKFALQHLLAIGGEGDPDVDHADASARAADKDEPAGDPVPEGWESWDAVNLSHKALNQRIKGLPEEIDRAPFKAHVDAHGGYPLAKAPFEALIGLVDRAAAKHKAMNMGPDSGGAPQGQEDEGAVPDDPEAAWLYLVESAETAQVDADGLKSLIEYTTGEAELAGPQMSKEQIEDVLAELERIVSGDLVWDGTEWVGQTEEDPSGGYGG